MRAAVNPTQVLAELNELTETILEFRNKSEARMTVIESNLADMACRNSGMEMNGNRQSGNYAELKALNEASRALISGN